MGSCERERIAREELELDFGYSKSDKARQRQGGWRTLVRLPHLIVNKNITL